MSSFDTSTPDSWRKEPPTSKQMHFLRKVDIETTGKFTRPQTKGEASDRIQEIIDADKYSDLYGYRDIAADLGFYHDDERFGD